MKDETATFIGMSVLGEEFRPESLRPYGGKAPLPAEKSVGKTKQTVE
jgi:hypothetical protein